jgi:hypothetical protein
VKTRAQIKAKIRQLAKLLDRAEDNYTMSVGLARDESRWKKRVTQLELQIEMLEWVLEEEE